MPSCFHHYSDEFPEMTGNPIFTGPVKDNRHSYYCYQNGFSYTDFHFDCRVQYPQQTTDDGARFKVSLTFDGKTDPNNAATHVTTNGIALTVSFPSIALKGNVGKSVNISRILHTQTVICGRGIMFDTFHVPSITKQMLYIVFIRVQCT